MKRNILLIISILIMIISFINGWYQDYLMSNTFLVAIIPSLILIIAEIICFIIALIKLNKTKDKIYILSQIILVLTIILVTVFPFSEIRTKIEFNHHLDKRMEVIDKIKNNELEIENGNIELPDEYKKVSIDGEVYVYQNDEQATVISFWVLRMPLSGSLELIYSSGGEQLIRNNEKGHPIVSINKIKENWYFVETEY